MVTHGTGGVKDACVEIGECPVDEECLVSALECGSGQVCTGRSVGVKIFPPLPYNLEGVDLFGYLL